MTAKVRAYSAAVAERFRRAPIAQPDGCCSGEAGSERAGARVRFFACAESGRLAQVGFRASACPHIIAACSLVAERLEGRPVSDMLDPAATAGLDELEIPVEKTGKILILQDALQACWGDFQSRQGAGASA